MPPHTLCNPPANETATERSLQAPNCAKYCCGEGHYRMDLKHKSGNPVRKLNSKNFTVILVSVTLNIVCWENEESVYLS